MKVDSIETVFRFALLAGSFLYFVLIFTLLKRKKLTVRYSLIWLLSGIVFLIFSIFPYTVLVLRDLLKMEMPQNVVFVLVIAFMLLVLLSLSTAVSGLTERAKRLTQANALLEKRVRELEARLSESSDSKS